MARAPDPGSRSANAEFARRKLSGMACVGPAPNLSSLTELELGQLAALVWDRRRNPNDPLVSELRAALCARAPKFEPPSDRIAMARLSETWAFGVYDADLTVRGSDPLALLPGYLRFAETVRVG